MESLIGSKESDDDHSKVFLYYIVPSSDVNEEGGENQSESWRGKTYYTHNLMKRLFENSSDQVAEQVSSLKAEMESKMETKMDNLETKMDKLT